MHCTIVIGFKSVFIFNLVKKITEKIKWIAIAISLPLVVFYLWNSTNDKPLNELLLIIAASEIQGQIVDAKEFDDVAETNDGRTTQYYEYYRLKYSFVTVKGKIVLGYTKRFGVMPEEYTKVARRPIKTTIEYLAKWPEINRMKGEEDVPNSLGEWFRLRGIILLGSIKHFV